jgi:hypothetical protein
MGPPILKANWLILTCQVIGEIGLMWQVLEMILGPIAGLMSTSKQKPMTPYKRIKTDG